MAEQIPSLQILFDRVLKTETGHGRNNYSPPTWSPSVLYVRFGCPFADLYLLITLCLAIPLLAISSPLHGIVPPLG